MHGLDDRDEALEALKVLGRLLLEVSNATVASEEFVFELHGLLEDGANLFQGPVIVATGALHLGSVRLYLTLKLYMTIVISAFLLFDLALERLHRVFELDELAVLGVDTSHDCLLILAQAFGLFRHLLGHGGLNLEYLSVQHAELLRLAIESINGLLHFTLIDAILVAKLIKLILQPLEFVVAFSI